MLEQSEGNKNETVMVERPTAKFFEPRAAKVVLHRVLEEKLTENVKNQRDENGGERKLVSPSFPPFVLPA